MNKISNLLDRLIKTKKREHNNQQQEKEDITIDHKDIKNILKFIMNKIS